MNKLIFASLIILTLEGCFPDFSPKKELHLEIKDDSVSIKWYKFIGTLDQVIPDQIVLIHKKIEDTLCIAYNIKSLNVDKEKIVIGFNGNPDVDSFFNMKSSGYGYEIIFDTAGVEEMNGSVSKDLVP